MTKFNKVHGVKGENDRKAGFNEKRRKEKYAIAQ